MKHICPYCNCEEATIISYSCPARAICKNCKATYEYGGIQIIGLAESIKKRPSMYEGYICKQCGKYTEPINNFEEMTDEDKEAIQAWNRRIK